MSDAPRLSSRLSVSVLLWVCLLLVSVPADAGPSADELGDLAGPLGKQITSEFLSTPLDRIVELLQRESGVTFIIDPALRGLISDQPVSLKVENATIHEVMELIALSTQVDWLVQGGVVFVSTDNAIVKRRVVGRVYDIRGMLIQVPNYRGPSLSVDDALSNTNSGGSNARQAESRDRGGSGGAGLFGDDTAEDMPSRSAFVNQVRELIQTTTGTPDYWLDEVFSISELNGSLVVRATPEVLAQVEQTLAGIDANLGKMLAIEAHYLVVPHGQIDELAGGYVMGPEACAALLAKLDGGNVRRLGTVRTVCHNGQRVYTYAGLDTGFLSDAEPVPDTGAIDPTVSTASNGVSMDIESTISFSETHVSVAVRSDLIHGAERRSVEVPVVGSGQGEGGGAVGQVPLELIEQAGVKYRTNVRVPDGGGVLLAGATSMFDEIDADEFEVVLLLRTYIVKEGGAAE